MQQIGWQVDQFGAQLDPENMDRLKMTPGQRELFAKAKENYSRTIGFLDYSADNRDAFAVLEKNAGTEYHQTLLKVLTLDQQVEFMELFGKPIDPETLTLISEVRSRQTRSSAPRPAK